MYEDSWYSYVPESKKDDTSHSSRHRRRESLLKQPNGSNQILDAADPLMEIFEEESGLKGPPKATLARRAKSYSDFYEAAIGYLGKEAGKEKPKDVLEVLEKGDSQISFGTQYEEYETGLLDASQEEYQLYRDQLTLSERHLDSLVGDTTSALDLLATLSESFKAVESQTTAFQAQCEDLLAEQKRLRDLADEVGTDLQYYAYLEPLTRRLNAPGAGRLTRSDDFLDMLTNLNTCIDFMDQHPDYRDSTIYKTRYISLLERSLNLVLMAFIATVKEVTDEVSKQLKGDLNETAQYIALYGKYEDIMENLGPQVEKLLKTAEFAFGGLEDAAGDIGSRRPYVQQYRNLFNQIAQAYIKSRDAVGPLVSKNLRKFASTEPKPDVDFQLFARRCVIHVFDICYSELNLIDRFFFGGPILLQYPGDRDDTPSNALSSNAEQLEQNRLSHVNTIQAFLAPYLRNGDLDRICTLVIWLETTYLVTAESEQDLVHKSTALFLLSEHLWPLCDSLFIKAAGEFERFRPSVDDLKVGGTPAADLKNPNGSQNVDTDTQIAYDPDMPTHIVSTAYPTVKTAVRLLITYNRSTFDRPGKGEVVYAIVHQATVSLQLAATKINNASGLVHAQLFLIKNLMLIRNLFLTHEIPESIRQTAELDFSPVWEILGELQARKQLFNPVAYINPLVRGHLLPAVVERVLDARKDLEKVLAKQIEAFTKYWQSRLTEKGQRKDAVLKAHRELEELLDKAALEETTKEGLWRMIRAEEL